MAEDPSVYLCSPGGVDSKNQSIPVCLALIGRHLVSGKSVVEATGSCSALRCIWDKILRGMLEAMLHICGVSMVWIELTA